jgi:CRP-like cAMP-binding protein
MAASDAARAPLENWLLAALPRKDYQRLLPRLEPVALAFQQVLFRAGQAPPFVYFPQDCVLSLAVPMADGTAVEFGAVGPEGMAGLPVFLDTEVSHGICRTQVPGRAMRLPAEAFREAARGDGPLPRLLRRYAHYLLVQVSQSLACNRLHAGAERLSRWLLMVQDGVGADQFPLTQEVMARMLGLRRPTVSLLAGALQKAGLIRYRRGKLTVLDRAGLEAAACDCYASVRGELERLLQGGHPHPRPGG